MRGQDVEKKVDRKLRQSTDLGEIEIMGGNLSVPTFTFWIIIIQRW